MSSSKLGLGLASVLVFLVATIRCSGITVKQAVVDTLVLLLPCPSLSVDDNNSTVWSWFKNNEELSAPSELATPHPNGSLSVRVRMEDMDSLYQCRATTYFFNGTSRDGDLFTYSIAPQVPAFLINPPKNMSVNLRSLYAFPCEAGGTDARLERRINGQLVRGAHVLVLIDSMIECTAVNAIGSQSESAFLKIIPGSDEGAFFDISPNFEDTCEVHSKFLPRNSPCISYLDHESRHLGDQSMKSGNFLVRRSRLQGHNLSDDAIGRLFSAWDLILTDNGTTVVTEDRALCLDQMKRLVCLFAYPLCQHIDDDEDEMDWVDDHLEETERSRLSVIQVQDVNICRQHCWAVASLMCAGDGEVAPLSRFFSASSPSAKFSSLLTKFVSLPEAVSMSFPSVLSKPDNNGQNEFHGDAVNRICGHLPQLKKTDLETSWKSLDRGCYPLIFDVGRKTQINNVEEIAGNCYTNRGEYYGGAEVASTECLPWSEVDRVVLVAYSQKEAWDSSHWPGLSALSPSVLGKGFASFRAGEASCRNPFGLAPRPFCLALTNYSIDGGHLPQLMPRACLQLHTCSELKLLKEGLAAADIAGIMRNRTPVSTVFWRSNVVVVVATSVAGACLVIVLLCVFACTLRSHRRFKKSTSSKHGSDLANSLAMFEGSTKHHDRRRRLIRHRRRLRATPRPFRYIMRILYRCRESARSQPLAKPDKAIGISFSWLSCCCPHSVTTQIPTVCTRQIFDSVDDEDVEVDELTTSMITGCGAGGRVCKSVNEGSISVPLRVIVATDDASPLVAASPSRQTAHKDVVDVSARFHLDAAFLVAPIDTLLHPKLRRLAYPRKLLIEERQIALRAFGTVILARAPDFPLRQRCGEDNDCETGSIQSALRAESSSSQSPLVVIKTLIYQPEPAAKVSFLREAELLVEFNHRNILPVLGICVPLNPLSLICEYMPKLDLHQCLQCYSGYGDSTVVGRQVGSSLSDDDDKSGDHRLTEHRLLRIALDICDAMIYLGCKSYVHRDVATRSALVAADWTTKLADFSLCCLVSRSDDLIDASMVALPVRWLPMESVLEGRFHFDTDVWSFGVFLWELFTLGGLPYGDIDVSDVISFVSEGHRLLQPPGCPDCLYRLMEQCWSAGRLQRPSFTCIRRVLLGLLDAPAQNYLPSNQCL